MSSTPSMYSYAFTMHFFRPTGNRNGLKKENLLPSKVKSRIETNQLGFYKSIIIGVVNSKGTKLWVYTFTIENLSRLMRRLI
jgi:hypothetical protein